MNAVINKILEGHRKIVVTGHFGTGKTEFAVSLAFALAGAISEISAGKDACRGGLSEEAAAGQKAKCAKRIALADLDIENPYFRSREKQEQLEMAGVMVYSDPFGGRNGTELQTISAGVRAPLEDRDCIAIMDTGGDHVGAKILNQFGRYFEPDGYQMFCVINKNRPGCDTLEKAEGHIKSIESVTGLRITGLVSNTHLIQETTAETVAEGWDFVNRLSERVGIPVICACCKQDIAEEIIKRGKISDAYPGGEGKEGEDLPVFPIGMFMRADYLDMKV